MMKALMKKPGFEAVFSLVILLMVVVPAMVFAQQNKSLTIVVRNGDTTVNGKKITELKQGEQKDAQKALAELGSSTPPLPSIYARDHYRLSPPVLDSMHSINRNGRYVITTSRPHVTGGVNVSSFRTRDTSKQNHYEIILDSVAKDGRKVYSMEERYYNGAPDRMPTIRPDLKRYRMPSIGERDRNEMPRNEFRLGRKGDFDAKQDFNYRTVDKNGIPTNVNFHITEAGAEKVKAITGAEKSTLAIADLVLLPIFSSGKTLIVCTLPSPTSAEITLMDDNNKVIFKEKNTGTQISQNVPLMINGVYYLVIKQGALTAVRKVVKE